MEKVRTEVTAEELMASVEQVVGEQVGRLMMENATLRLRVAKLEAKVVELAEKEAAEKA